MSYGSATNRGDPSVNGDEDDKRHDLEAAHDDDEPGGERGEGFHLVLHEGALPLQLRVLLPLLVTSELHRFGAGAEPVSSDGATTTHLIHSGVGI